MHCMQKHFAGPGGSLPVTDDGVRMFLRIWFRYRARSLGLYQDSINSIFAIYKAELHVGKIRKIPSCVHDLRA